MEIKKESAQVEIVSQIGRVYLYSHEGASSIVKTVFEALSKRKRWDDADYLARIVFCEMIPAECWESDSGYGIGTTLYASTNVLVTIDTERQRVIVQSALNKHESNSYTFESFIESFASNAKL
jgi:hypothetical protein